MKGHEYKIADFDWTSPLPLFKKEIEYSFKKQKQKTKTKNKTKLKAKSKKNKKRERCQHNLTTIVPLN